MEMLGVGFPLMSSCVLEKDTLTLQAYFFNNMLILASCGAGLNTRKIVKYIRGHF